MCIATVEICKVNRSSHMLSINHGNIKQELGLSNYYEEGGFTAHVINMHAKVSLIVGGHSFQSSKKSKNGLNVYLN
jgi:hypothetical protein